MPGVWRKLAPVGVVLAALIALIVWRARHRHGSVATPAPDRVAGEKLHPHDAHAPSTPTTVSGHVTRKADGAPIAGAVVALARGDAGLKFEERDTTNLVSVTDAAGAWTAPKVPPGQYVVTATAKGYLPGAHDKIAVVSGEARSGIDVALAPGGTLVHGTVSDVGGGPIAGARVAAVRASLDSIASGPTPYLALTGNDGRYELTLPDGPFALSAGHDDYAHQSRQIELAGKPLTEDFALVPGAVIRGQVVARDTGKPVAGAAVVAHSGRGFAGGLSEATCDGDGKFVLHSLRSGAISIEAAARGYASAQPTTVEVGIGEQVDGVRVVVAHALSISGRVVDKATKKGIAGVHIGAWSMGTQQQATAPDPTDDDGAFEIVGVKPASYMLFAIAEDKMPELGKTVEVSDKDVTGVVVEMATGATLSGRVDPPQVASLGLSLVGEIGLGNLMDVMKTAFVHTESDASGQFVLRHVPAGKFTLAAVTREGPAGKLPVTVSDSDQQGLVVTLETRASIAGRVVDTRGAPVAGLRVRARPTERSHAISAAMSTERSGTTSGGDGSFKLVGLEAGTYSVEAGDLEDMVERTTSKDKDTSAATITLAAGDAKTGVTVTVAARDGVIRGQVIGTDGQATADAWVTARRDTGSLGAVMVGGGYDFTPSSEPVLTGADGKFTIDHLRDGTYTVVADGPRGASRAEKHDVKPGTTVTLTLASLGTLSGHVTQAAAAVPSYDLSCRGPAGGIDRHIDAQDGGYTLEHLAPGSYTCEAQADAGTAKGEVDVPAGAATLDLQLAPWASLTGTVVSVLDGSPVPGVLAIADMSGRDVAALLSGGGPVTDASGRFTIDHVSAGSGSVLLIPKQSFGQQLAHTPYTVAAGQHLDLGTIKVTPPRTGDAGTLGLSTEPAGDALSVTAVEPGGPAAQAGIVTGDKITAIDGHAVRDLTAEVADHLVSSGNVSVGQTLALTLARGATIAVTAAKW